MFGFEPVLCCLVCSVLCMEESPSHIFFFSITDRRDIGLYDVPMLMSLLGLGIGMMLANFHT